MTTPTTTTRLVIDVTGQPIPQGSMVGFKRGRSVVVIPDNATELKPWRKAVTSVAQARARLTGWLTIDGPVAVTLDFYLARPTAAKKRRWPHVRPDIDKLTRACLDGLTDAAVFVDDARVVELHARKHYAEATTGVRIVVEPMESVLL